MNFKKRVLTIILAIKNEQFNEKLPKIIPVYDGSGEMIGFLRPITNSTIKNSKEIELLAKWRKENEFAFPSQFPVTVEGTKKWTQNQLLLNRSRILFFVESIGKKLKLIGHLGLYSFDFKKKSCEIDNVVRGEKDYHKGLMTYSMNTLIGWTQMLLKPDRIYLRVFSDNNRAVEFYKRCHFKPKEKIPLIQKVESNSVTWEESKKLKKADKYFLKMEYKSE